MNIAVLCIGGNDKDSLLHIRNTLDLLKTESLIFYCSKLYNTKALNFKSADYINCVCVISSDLSYEMLKSQFKGYEKESGRTSESKIEGIIPLDIDIVIWNRNIVKPFDIEQDYFKMGWNDIKDKYESNIS